MENQTIPSVIAMQREYFASNCTKTIDFRIEQLRKLKNAILSYENKIIQALQSDFNKAPFESYSTEIMIALRDIDFYIHHLPKWAKPVKAKTGLLNFPSRGYIITEPLGLIMIMAPWNYPFQLIISPLVAAIAAGNCAVLKPAELSANTSKVLKELVENAFDKNYISIFLGGKDTNEALLNEKFDFIFFTGSPELGKVIMKEAAKFLTPVCLELGGKTPCIVDKTANLKLAARRIAWGKFINAGQTCVAPDYLYIHHSIKDTFLIEFQHSIQKLYGANAKESPDYARIISEAHFDRVFGYLKDGKIFYGGNIDKTQKYIEPTIIVDASTDSPVMKEEIFGPVFPVLTFENINEVINFVNERPKPLAFYLFSTDTKVHQDVLSKTSSGGACINDVIMQLTSHHLPFGGVGNSGMGRYHGKAGFDLFSNKRSVLEKANWLDVPLRYAPYGNRIKLIRKLWPFLG
jgi:aldehyde dehydrogenase (NAD+)